MTEFGRGVDPVPPAARRADPERDERARQLEWEIEAVIHPDYDRPLEPEDRQSAEQRVHYILFSPGREPPRHPADWGSIPAGFIWWDRGAWWWRLSEASAENRDPYGLGAKQELDVETEEEAILHARRRVAWGLAG